MEKEKATSMAIVTATPSLGEGDPPRYSLPLYWLRVRYTQTHQEVVYSYTSAVVRVLAVVGLEGGGYAEVVEQWETGQDAPQAPIAAEGSQGWLEGRRAS